MLQRLGVVKAQVLHVQHGKIPWLEDFHYLSKRGNVAAGEDAFPGPGTEGTLVVASNEVEKSTSGLAQRAMDYASSLCVVICHDVLQHPDRSKNNKPAGNISRSEERRVGKQKSWRTA